MDILDIVNWLGTILSSRRSAQIALFEYGQPEWEEFAIAKKEWWLKGNAHRQQSNNSLLFMPNPAERNGEVIPNDVRLGRIRTRLYQRAEAKDAPPGLRDATLASKSCSEIRASAT